MQLFSSSHAAHPRWKRSPCACGR